MHYHAWRVALILLVNVWTNQRITRHKLPPIKCIHWTMAIFIVSRFYAQHHFYAIEKGFTLSQVVCDTRVYVIVCTIAHTVHWCMGRPDVHNCYTVIGDIVKL